jgi:2,3-bisphosphoglycerate-independent phosphoglycerate mutase
LILRRPEQIQCTPPHDAIGLKVEKVLPKAKSPKAEKQAKLLRSLIEGSREILCSHPVNINREKTRKRPGNLIWLWGGGKKPAMPTLKEKFGVNGAVISAVDLVKGIGSYAGMQVINVPGATGLANTNYEGKADAALKALESNDFVCIHVEAPMKRATAGLQVEGKNHRGSRQKTRRQTHRWFKGGALRDSYFA